MKALLEFKLPEDSVQHIWAVHAPVFVRDILEIDNHCRNALKHGHCYKTPEDVLEAVREMLNDSMSVIIDN